MANASTDLAFFLVTGGDSSCDSATGWGTSFTPDTEMKVQGTGAGAAKVSNTTYTNVFTMTNTVDLTDQNIYCWMACLTVAILDTKENGGFRIRATDASGNYKEWYVGGKTVGGVPMYTGGWECYCVNVNTTPNASSGTLAINAVKSITVTCKTTGSTSKTNFYWDGLRHGTCLQIDGGTSGSPGTFSDLVSLEATGAYGVIRSYKGMLLVQGKLKFGSTTGGTATYFKDTTGPILLFLNSMYASGFCDIILQGNGSANTEVYFGDYVGGMGVQGPVIKSENSGNTFKLTLNGSNVTKYGLYGATLVNPNTITLPAYDANKIVSGCMIIAGAEMMPDTGIVDSCNFISSASRAIRISSASHHVTNCNFINCQTAINHDTGGGSGSHLHYDYDALVFFGCTYDIENSAVTPNYYIDIDRISGSNPDSGKINNSGGGSTTILDISVQLTLTGLIDGSDISILDAGTETERVNVQQNSGTTYIYGYNYVADDHVDVGVFKAGYIPFYVRNFLLPASDGSLPIAQQIDRAYLE